MNSMYEEWTNPQKAQQLAQQKECQEKELIQLYISHEEFLQSFDFQCDASCAILNIHEQYAERGIVPWPTLPNVQVCQQHERLRFNPSDAQHVHLVKLYCDEFLDPQHAPTEPCNTGCVFLSVPMTLYRAKKWNPPWLPLFVCKAHSTMHLCHNNQVKCRNEGRENRCIGCQDRRLCMERCPMNANSVDHDACHICFFSKRGVGYLSSAEDISRRRVALATDFVPMKKALAPPDPARYADDAIRMLEKWLTFSIQLTNRAQHQLPTLLSREAAMLKITSFLIEHASVDEESGLMNIEPRDVWQYLPCLYAETKQINVLPPVPSDAESIAKAATALYVVYNDLTARRFPLAEVMKMLNLPITFATCSVEKDDKGIVLGVYKKTIEPTPLLYHYALRLREGCPPSVGDWLAKTKAPLPEIAGTECPPYYVAVQALRLHPLFFAEKIE